MRAVKAEEISVKTDNKVGALAGLAKLISAASVNVRAISAWAVGDKALFRLITSDNGKTKEILKQNNYSFDEKGVIVVELPDKVGELEGLTSKLKEANIDLQYIYGTTSKPECEAIVVLSSSDDEKALGTLGS